MVVVRYMPVGSVRTTPAAHTPVHTHPEPIAGTRIGTHISRETSKRKDKGTEGLAYARPAQVLGALARLIIYSFQVSGRIGPG